MNPSWAVTKLMLADGAVPHGKNIAGPSDTQCKLADDAAIALPEAPHSIAIAVVPFRPAGREVSELIAIGAYVPRFSDEFHLREDRILADGVEKSGELVERLSCSRASVVARSKRKPSTCIS